LKLERSDKRLLALNPAHPEIIELHCHLEHKLLN